MLEGLLGMHGTVLSTALKINKQTNKQAGMNSLGGGAGESGVQDHSWLHNEFQRQPEIPSQK